MQTGTHSGYTRPAEYSPRGHLAVKPSEKMSPLVRELVASEGQPIGEQRLVAQPLTEQELTSEEKSLRRQLKIIVRRLNQIGVAKKALPPPHA